MTENALRHTRQTKCNCFDTSCNYCNDSSSNLTVHCWHAYHVDVLYTSSNHAELKEVVLCLRTIQSTRTADVCGPAKLSTNITAASHKGVVHALRHTHTHPHGDSQRGWAALLLHTVLRRLCCRFSLPPASAINAAHSGSSQEEINRLQAPTQLTMAKHKWPG